MFNVELEEKRKTTFMDAGKEDMEREETEADDVLLWSLKEAAKWRVQIKAQFCSALNIIKTVATEWEFALNKQVLVWNGGYIDIMNAPEPSWKSELHSWFMHF